MRIVMLSPAPPPTHQRIIAKARYANVDKMNYEAPLLAVDHVIVHRATYLVSWRFIPVSAAILRNGRTATISRAALASHHPNW